ncbi:UNVERIFIED_CONTAM: hypothetical protein K2H54_054210 [Gekko kuhli]
METTNDVLEEEEAAAMQVRPSVSEHLPPTSIETQPCPPNHPGQPPPPTLAPPLIDCPPPPPARLTTVAVLPLLLEQLEVGLAGSEPLGAGLAHPAQALAGLVETAVGRLDVLLHVLGWASAQHPPLLLGGRLAAGQAALGEEGW